MTMNKFIICGVVIGLSQSLASAQNENAFLQSLTVSDRDQEQFAEIYRNLKLMEDGKTPADERELKQLLKDHGDFLFKGENVRYKYSVVSRLCELITRSPDRQKIVPDLMAGVFELEAPTSKSSELGDWDKLVIRGRGDRIGVLMYCILEVSGEVSGKEAFEQMFDHFQKRGQLAKITILLEQVAMRKDSGKYVELLSQKLETQQDIKIKEALQSALSRMRGKQ